MTTQLPDTSSKPARSAFQKQGMMVFWALFAISFLNYLDRNLLVGASDVVAHELGLSINSIGFIASAFLVVYTIGTIPMGIWADRAKRKNVIAFCVTVWSIATALTALSFNFLSLFISRMILGIGEAGYFPAGTAMLGDYFHRETRSRMMSWWSVSQLIGIFWGFVIGGVVAGLYTGSWRLAFIFTGIPGLGLEFWSWKLREPRRNEADEEEIIATYGADAAQVKAPPAKSQNMLKNFGFLLRIKTLVVLTVMQVFAFFVLSVSIIYLPILLQQKDKFGFSSGAAGTFSGSVVILAGTIGTVGGGYLVQSQERSLGRAKQGRGGH